MALVERKREATSVCSDPIPLAREGVRFGRSGSMPGRDRAAFPGRAFYLLMKGNTMTCSEGRLLPESGKYSGLFRALVHLFCTLTVVGKVCRLCFGSSTSRCFPAVDGWISGENFAGRCFASVGLLLTVLRLR